MVQGGVVMVQNGARKGDDGVKWGKVGWKQCRMGQGGVVMVENRATVVQRRAVSAS